MPPRGEQGDVAGLAHGMGWLSISAQDAISTHGKGSGDSIADAEPGRG